MANCLNNYFCLACSLLKKIHVCKVCSGSHKRHNEQGATQCYQAFLVCKSQPSNLRLRHRSFLFVLFSDFCAAERSFRRAHPCKSCTNYITCYEGKVFEQRCPIGTVFDSSKRDCNWPRNVPECENVVNN